MHIDIKYFWFIYQYPLLVMHISTPITCYAYINIKYFWCMYQQRGRQMPRRAEAKRWQGACNDTIINMKYIWGILWTCSCLPTKNAIIVSTKSILGGAQIGDKCEMWPLTRSETPGGQGRDRKEDRKVLPTTEPVDALHVLMQALFMIHFRDLPILYIHPFLY